MANLWKVFNFLNLVAIVLVIVFSEEITESLNYHRDCLNNSEELSDGQHVLRWIINKWEGLALAGSLTLFFFVRKVLGLLGGVVNKVSTTQQSK